MSPVTGLARLPGRILLSVHMGNFSPVDRLTGLKFNKTNMVKHKLVSFATVIALWSLVNLLVKLIRMLLKWKYIHCKNYAILAAMMRKRSYFVKKVPSRSPGLECSYGKIFIPVTEISVAKTEISVTGPARALIILECYTTQAFCEFFW